MDVRGTAISAIADEPIDRELAALIRRVHAEGIRIAFVSGGSIETVRSLIVRPLAQTSFVAYVNSATEGFSIRGGLVRTLERYPVMRFTSRQRAAVESAVMRLKATAGLMTSTKRKPGQLNFYCDAPWRVRRKLASELRRDLLAQGHPEIHVLTPSAREVLDITVCTKARAIQDLRQRFGYAGDELLILGDSFQGGGSDVAMALAAPGSIAVHVGSMRPVRGVLRSPLRGSEGCARTLETLLAACTKLRAP
jgi:hydroxymethylpyrimidine pyrophosphatase-like HAD family hydrolase